jgi:hypothetical protein
MMTGPLTLKMGGRIWARAFLDTSLRRLLEENLRDATAAFFLERISPLFDYQNDFFAHLAANFNPGEQQQVQDNLFNKTTQKYRNLAAKLKGNGFTIFRGTVPVYGPDPLRNDIDNIPKGPNSPLTRDDWVRVYTKAHLEPGFKDRLRRSPAETIDEFHAAHGLGHNSGAPVFKFPTLTDLLQAIPPGDPLKNQATLEQTLHRIANAIDPQCDATLEITLTC